MNSGVRMRHRVTSLEQWGKRVHADFQRDSVAVARDAGFTGVFLNGGSGFGPDMLTPESLVRSNVLPDLMPLTIEANQREARRRDQLLLESGLDAWLCLWGVPGPDESEPGECAESNHYFDRLTRLEMTAKLARSPEIFGRRNPRALNWRGSRPLCVSHPLVQEYYGDLMGRLIETYPRIAGVVYFPGDNNSDLCDDSCPRCRDTGLGAWGVTIRYVNLLFESLQKSKHDIKFYFAVWNQEDSAGDGQIPMFLRELHPQIGLCMTLSDVVRQKRKSGTMVFHQPWVNCVTPGEQFLRTVRAAQASSRSVMPMGEFSQAEIWDPVCHNMPNPAKVIDWLNNAQGIEAVDAMCDFWGHRRPFVSHANLAALSCWLEAPDAPKEELLRRAAIRHYQLGAEQAQFIPAALNAWRRFDEVVDDWALCIWSQRFSFAIGRDGARGRLFPALLPAALREVADSWMLRTLNDTGVDPDTFLRFQLQDRQAFLQVAQVFHQLATEFHSANNTTGATLARREGTQIELAGELLASVGRTFAATAAWQREDFESLRRLVRDEIDAREQQLEITGRIGFGGGVNHQLVSEDVQNMRLFLSHDGFPQVPKNLFGFTPSPYTV